LTKDKTAKLSIGFVLQPQFTLLSLSGMIEALRIAADAGGLSQPIHCRWTLMTTDGEPATASCGVTVTADSDLLPAEQFDYLVVVGSLLHVQQANIPELERYIQQAAQKGVPLIGACTGSFALARAGVMHGYRCCVHHYHADAFEAQFPDIEIVSDQLYVIDHDRITSPGGTSPLDLTVHLIEQHLGHESAAKVNEMFIFDEARKASHPQTRFVTQWTSSIQSPLVQRAILIMQRHIRQPLSVADIASQLSISGKKLEREFKQFLTLGPKESYLRLRLDRSLWHLQHTDHALAVIANLCGFSDASHFSQAFKKAFELTPSEARRRLKSGDTIKGLIYGANLQSELMVESVEGVTR